MPKERPLTAKQMAFAGFVANGLTYTESYRKAYGAGGYSATALGVEASRLMKNERIKAAVEELKADKKETRRSQEKLNSAWILQRLREEAIDDSNPPSTRVRALELLGKSEGVFEENTKLTVEHRTPEDVEKELSQRLSDILGEPN